MTATHQITVDVSLEALQGELAESVAEVSKEARVIGVMAYTDIAEVLEVALHVGVEARVRLNDGRIVRMPFTFRGDVVELGADNCPTCGRRIKDFDMTGREDESGQRHCVEHPLEREVEHVDDGLGDEFEAELERYEAGRD